MADRLIIWGIDIAGSKRVDADHNAIVVGASRLKDKERRIYVPWWWHHRHLDMFDLADVVRAVRVVFPPNRVVGDDGGHGAIMALSTLEKVLHLHIEPKPRDVMNSVRDTNDEFRTKRLVLATKDVYTDRIIKAAEKLYEAEPDRLLKVRMMLLNVPTETNPRNVKLDLPTELGQVIKTVNEKTRKFEVNKRGKHSDGTEACRYMVSGFVRSPALPEKKRVLTDDERIRLSDMEYARKFSRSKRRPFG